MEALTCEKLKTGEPLLDTQNDLISEENLLSERQPNERFAIDHLHASRKGGLITMPFIIANEAFLNVASYGLLPNMILYLIGEYGMKASSAANILFLWLAAINFVPILGAFVADSYTGRYSMIGLGSIASLLGTVLLWLTAMIPHGTPCHDKVCSPQTATQLMLLYSSIILIAVGSGGIRSSSLVFGADQLNNNINKDSSKSEIALESYFNWYYVSVSVAVLVGITVIVYIQEAFGWKIGFGVPVILMFLSGVSFYLASRLYIKRNAKTSLLSGHAQVLMAAFRKRRVTLSSANSLNTLYHHEKGSKLKFPSKKLRFFNNACIVTNPDIELTPDGASSNRWSLCTVDQVEELKSVIRVVPLWSTGIIPSVTYSQSAIITLQASLMDRHLGSNFEIPAGSFIVFDLISMTLWVALYDRVLLPVASKIRGKPTRIGVKWRMAAGLILSFFTMAVSAVVESVRRTGQEGIHAEPQMSAMWLVPQYFLCGISNTLFGVAQNEFYYSELPKSMSSISSTLLGLGMSLGNLTGSLIVSTINAITTSGGKTSWVSSDLDAGHYDYYYWVIAGLTLINFFYFGVCSRCYGPCKGEGGRHLDKDDQERNDNTS